VGEGQPVLALDHGRQDAVPLRGRARPGDEAAAEAHRGQIGLHEQTFADRLHDQHHVDGGPAEATVRLGERQAEQAHLGDGPPHVVAPARRRGEDLGARIEAVVGGDEALDGLGQQRLLLAQLEVHRVLSPLTDRA
jgi:hypothetical protein